MQLTITKSKTAGTDLALADETAEEIRVCLADCEVGEKNGPAIIPAVFRPCPPACRNHGMEGRKDCGGGVLHRLGANVVEMTGLGIDLDHLGAGEIERVIETIRAKGLEAHWWHTFSHDPGKDERARLLFPFAEPLPVKSPAAWSRAAWPALVAHVGLGEIATADHACRDPARVYYTPRKPTAEAVRGSGYIPGSPLDWRKVDLGPLEAFPAVDSVPARAPQEDPSRPVDLSALRERLGRIKNGPSAPLVARLLAGAALVPPPDERPPGAPSRYEAWRSATASLSLAAEEWHASEALYELLRPSWQAECAEDPDDPTEWGTITDLLAKARSSAPIKKAERQAAEKATKSLWAKTMGAKFTARVDARCNPAIQSNVDLRKDILRNETLPTPSGPAACGGVAAAKISPEIPQKTAISKNASGKNAPAAPKVAPPDAADPPESPPLAQGGFSGGPPGGDGVPPRGPPAAALGAWPDGSDILTAVLEGEALFRELETTTSKAGDLKVRNTLVNVENLLERSADWRGAFRWNLLSNVPEVWRGPLYRGAPHVPGDVDTTEVRLWFARHPELATVFKKEDVEAIMSAAAYRHRYDPIVQYLRSIKWDGKPRIEGMLETYFNADTGGAVGAAAGRVRYVRAISKKWMISAAARGLRPGAKVDTTLVFRGGQGAKKTTALAVLGGEWYVEFSYPLDSDEAMLAASAKWIGEFGELRSLKTADLERTKSFLSRTHDTYRVKYAKNVTDHPRRIVFAASTNEDEIFSDPTGNRRFWAVTSKDIDLDALKRDRDQLWAEAVMCFQAGEQWWLTPEEEALAAPEVQAYAVANPHAERIAEWFAERDPKARPPDMATLEVAREIFGLDYVESKDTRAIVGALKSLGFVPSKRYWNNNETRVHRTPKRLLEAPKVVMDRSTPAAVGAKKSARAPILS